MIRDKLMNSIITKKMIKKGKADLKRLDENSRSAVSVSEELLKKLVYDARDTEYGKKYDFAGIKSVEDYKKKVPFSKYDDYAPYIERMIKKGEKNLITPEPVIHYALSSGSVGVPKHIPVTQKTLDLYCSYTCNNVFASMDEYYRNKTGHSFPAGKGLYALEARPMYLPNGTPKGPISATTLQPVKKYLKYIFSSPLPIVFPEGRMNMKYLKIRYALQERDLSFMIGAFMTAMVDLMTYTQANWEMIVEDIAEGKINEDIEMPDELRAELESKLKPDRNRAMELKKEFDKGFDTPIIPRIWKNMSWICAIGTGGFAMYTEKMRQYSGDIPIHFHTYAASEALMATARYPEEQEFVLVPDSGFYEFIPVDAEDQETTYTIGQLEKGKDYELILTNTSGFYRYKLDDVIRVTGFHGESPKITFVYRKNQMISIAGEKTNEESFRWAIGQFSRETGCAVADYSIFADTDATPGRYVVLIEPENLISKEKLEGYRDVIEEKLSIANPSFGSKIQNNVLGKTAINIEQLQTYALYRELMYQKGISANQLKPVRVIDTPIKEKFFFKLTEKY